MAFLVQRRNSRRGSGLRSQPLPPANSLVPEHPSHPARANVAAHHEAGQLPDERRAPMHESFNNALHCACRRGDCAPAVCLLRTVDVYVLVIVVVMMPKSVQKSAGHVPFQRAARTPGACKAPAPSCSSCNAALGSAVCVVQLGTIQARVDRLSCDLPGVVHSQPDSLQQRRFRQGRHIMSRHCGAPGPVHGFSIGRSRQ